MEPEPSTISRSIPENPNKKAKVRTTVGANGIIVYYSAFTGPVGPNTWVQLDKRPIGYPKAEIIFTQDEMSGAGLEIRFKLDVFRSNLFENHFQKCLPGPRGLRMFAVHREDDPGSTTFTLVSTTAGLLQHILLFNSKYEGDGRLEIAAEECLVEYENQPPPVLSPRSLQATNSTTSPVSVRVSVSTALGSTMRIRDALVSSGSPGGVAQAIAAECEVAGEVTGGTSRKGKRTHSDIENFKHGLHKIHEYAVGSGPPSAELGYFDGVGLWVGLHSVDDFIRCSPKVESIRVCCHSCDAGMSGAGPFKKLNDSNGKFTLAIANFRLGALFEHNLRFHAAQKLTAEVGWSQFAIPAIALLQRHEDKVKKLEQQSPPTSPSGPTTGLPVPFQSTATPFNGVLVSVVILDRKYNVTLDDALSRNTGAGCQLTPAMVELSCCLEMKNSGFSISDSRAALISLAACKQLDTMIFRAENETDISERYSALGMTAMLDKYILFPETSAVFFMLQTGISYCLGIVSPPCVGNYVALLDPTGATANIDRLIDTLAQIFSLYYSFKQISAQQSVTMSQVPLQCPTEPVATCSSGPATAALLSHGLTRLAELSNVDGIRSVYTATMFDGPNKYSEQRSKFNAWLMSLIGSSESKRKSLKEGPPAEANQAIATAAAVPPAPVTVVPAPAAAATPAAAAAGEAPVVTEAI